MKSIYGFLSKFQEQSTTPTQNQTDQDEFLRLTHQLIQHQVKQMDVEKIIDVIKQLTHYAIKGDNELHKMLFELFMEKDILLRYYDILQKNSSPTILVQEIFESVSSLLLNIREITNRNYILSHTSISNMVLWKAPFEQINPNIELVETYISFLNLLAVKLDEVSSMFFINIRYPQFPLLWNAVRFYNHQELMVRNKSRSIVLHILNINNPNIAVYTNSFPFIFYYYNLGNQLIITIRQANVLVEQIKWKFDSQKFSKLQSISEELSEQLQYIHDLISNNENIQQLILDYVLQRPIIFISQVIKYGFSDIDITIALQIFYLFIKYFQSQPKILQYLYKLFLNDDRQKISLIDQQWEYLNILDIDCSFVNKQSKIIFDTHSPVDLMELNHENFDIKKCLQSLRQVDQFILQSINGLELDELSLECFNKIMQHISNKDAVIYILLIMRHFNFNTEIQLFQDNVLTLLSSSDQQLIIMLLSSDILCKVKQTKRISDFVKQLYDQLINEITRIIFNHQFFMDQLIDIFQKYLLNYFRKMIKISQEFLINDSVNFQAPQYSLLFDPYSSLSNLHKLQYNIILSQHEIFKNYDQINQSLPELTSLKNKYTIGQKAECKMISCQYSETGHFYDMQKYYILDTDNFLHIVQIDENQIITDVICSKLWQLLSIWEIERVQVLLFTYFDYSKFYIRLQNFDDVQSITSTASLQQQQFSDWFRELLIAKLKNLQSQHSQQKFNE